MSSTTTRVKASNKSATDKDGSEVGFLVVLILLLLMGSCSAWITWEPKVRRAEHFQKAFGIPLPPLEKDRLELQREVVKQLTKSRAELDKTAHDFGDVSEKTKNASRSTPEDVIQYVAFAKALEELSAAIDALREDFNKKCDAAYYAGFHLETRAVNCLDNHSVGGFY